MITQISMIFQYVSYLCNRLLIGVIRDFWTFSEISFLLFIGVYQIRVKNQSKKGGA